MQQFLYLEYYHLLTFCQRFFIFLKILIENENK